VRLFAVRPEVLFPYYNPLVDVSTRDLLGIRDEPLLLAVLHHGGEQHPGAVTVDLLAPIAANPCNRCGSPGGPGRRLAAAGAARVPGCWCVSRLVAERPRAPQNHLNSYGAPVNTLHEAGVPEVRMLASTATLPEVGTSWGKSDPPPMIAFAAS